MIIIFAILTFISTLVGGLVGLKYKDKFHLILGFTAGVLVSVVAFDILPELATMTTGHAKSFEWAMMFFIAGFLVFHVIEKLLVIHKSQEGEYGHHHHPAVGIFSALALAGHSFLDGVGIGLGFHISSTVGVLIAIAVIAHDFSDGLNTVSLMLVNKNTDRRALQFLLIDAIAPVAGVAFAIALQVPPDAVIAYLGFFAGFLMYIGASDILPQAHSGYSSKLTLAMTLLGVAFIYVITRFV